MKPLRVSIPTPLHAYSGAPEVEACGATVGELLDDLDRRFPGIRFRMVDEQDAIRPHIRIFVNRERVTGLDARLGPDDQIQILQALSGG